MRNVNLTNVTMRNRRRFVPILAAIAALGLVLAACGDDKTTDTSTPADTTPKPSVTIGIQDFGESEVLANVYGELLSAKGYDVKYKKLGGYRDVVYSTFAATTGGIDFTAEYAASALEFLLKQSGKPTGVAGPDAKANAEALRPLLKDLQLTAFAPAPAIDANSLVVTKDVAAAKSLTKISDLTPDLRLGGPPDCLTNPFCIPGIKEKYGIDLSANFVSLDGGGPKTKEALNGNEIDVAVIFSSDSSLATKPWVALDDDKQLFTADAVIPVLTQKLADAGGESFESLVDSVSAKLTTEKLIGMNKSFDVDKEDAKDIAKTFLTDAGLL